jgi:hypothetical protein
VIPEFSIAVRLTHFFNFLFLSLLVRSGIEILGAHPKLYWRGGQGGWRDDVLNYYPSDAGI